MNKHKDFRALIEKARKSPAYRVERAVLEKASRKVLVVVCGNGGEAERACAAKKASVRKQWQSLRLEEKPA